MNNKVLNGLTIFDLIAFGCTFIIGILALIFLNHVDQMKTNHDIFPFYDTIFSSDDPIVLGEWPGTQSGSYKDGTLHTRRCRRREYRCTNVSSTSSVTIKKWKGKTFSTNTSISFDYLFNNTVPFGEECPAGKKKCGLLDTMNNVLCLDEKEQCPINLMLFSNSPEKPEEYNYTFGKIALNDMTYLHYTNQAVDKHIITSHFTLSDDKVCAKPENYNSPYVHSVLDNYKYGCTEINGTLFHPFYEKLDTVLKYNLYEENGIISKVSSVKGYPISYFKTQYTSLYYSPFIGYDKKCLANYPDSFNKVERQKSKQKVINILEIVSFVLLIVEIGLYIFMIVHNKGIDLELKVKWPFAIGSTVLGGIELGLLLAMMSMNYDNVCFDEFNTKLLLYYARYHSEMEIFVLLKMIFLFAQVLAFLIIGIYYLIAEKQWTVSYSKTEKFVPKETNMADLKYTQQPTPSETKTETKQEPTSNETKKTEPEKTDDISDFKYTQPQNTNDMSDNKNTESKKQPVNSNNMNSFNYEKQQPVNSNELNNCNYPQQQEINSNNMNGYNYGQQQISSNDMNTFNYGQQQPISSNDMNTYNYPQQHPVNQNNMNTLNYGQQNQYTFPYPPVNNNYNGGYQS